MWMVERGGVLVRGSMSGNIGIGKGPMSIREEGAESSLKRVQAGRGGRMKREEGKDRRDEGRRMNEGDGGG